MMERFEAIVARTLNEGGATFDRKGELVVSGFAVADGHTKMVRREELNAEWLARWTGELNARDGVETFGTWIDSEDPDWVWIEASRVYDDEAVAAAVAEATHEIAYFNITDAEEVRL